MVNLLCDICDIWGRFLNVTIYYIIFAPLLYWKKLKNNKIIFDNNKYQENIINQKLIVKIYN